GADREHRGRHDQHARRARGRGRGRAVDRGGRGGKGGAVVPGRADLPAGRRVRRCGAVRGPDTAVRAGRAAVDRRWTARALGRGVSGGGSGLVRHTPAGRPAAVRAGRICLRDAVTRAGARRPLGRRRGCRGCARARGGAGARDAGVPRLVGSGAGARGGRGAGRVDGASRTRGADAAVARSGTGARGGVRLRRSAGAVGVASVHAADGCARDRRAARAREPHSARVAGGAGGRVQRAARAATVPLVSAARQPAGGLAAASQGTLGAPVAGSVAGRRDRVGTRGDRGSHLRRDERPGGVRRARDRLDRGAALGVRPLRGSAGGIRRPVASTRHPAALLESKPLSRELPLCHEPGGASARPRSTLPSTRPWTTRAMSSIVSKRSGTNASSGTSTPNSSWMNASSSTTPSESTYPSWNKWARRENAGSSRATPKWRRTNPSSRAAI